MKKNRKIVDSFKNALKGIWFCIKSERNFRIHTIGAFYVLILASLLKLTSLEFAVLFVVIGIMIMAEAFNTAIEKLCDFVCKARNRQIGIVKDVSAAAVFLASFMAVAVGITLLFKPQDLLIIAQNIFANPLYIILLLGSLIISTVYIFLGPIGIKGVIHKTKKH